MFLDEIVIENREKLNTAIRTLLDGEADGPAFMLTYEHLTSTNYSIAIELSELLSRQKPRDHQEIWADTLRILRLMPWRVDPEENCPQTDAEKIAGVYHFFGGLGDSALDELRPMVEQGCSWEEIVNSACLLAGDLV